MGGVFIGANGIYRWVGRRWDGWWGVRPLDREAATHAMEVRKFLFDKL